jgi:hypothetical protein
MSNYYIKGTSLVEMLSGYNGSGTTTNYTNMGSYTSALSNYRRFDYIAYKNNDSNALSPYESLNYTYTTPGTYSLSSIPSWCNKIRVLAIGGGGSGNISVNVGGGSYRYGTGQGGGMLLYDIIGNFSTTSLTLICGSGGTYSNTPEQNTHGTPTYMTITNTTESITMYANGGRKGNLNNTAGTNADGAVVIPASTTMTLSPYVTSSNGELIVTFSSSGYSVKTGGRSGLSMGYVRSYFTTTDVDDITSPFIPGNGGSSTIDQNDTRRNGTNGFISIHLLPY